MKKNNTFEEIWTELRKAKRVLMTLHYRPDGDSLGSCTAMKYVLEKQGVEVKLISKDDLSENLKDFEFAKEIGYGENIEDEDLGEFDYIILLDYAAADSDFSKEFMEKIKNSNVINIDHHETNSYFGKLNYVNPKLPSSCSVLFEMFESQRIKFDRELSLRLLLGICTDTGFFRYGNTIDSMKKAIHLIEAGKINYERDICIPIKSDPWNLKKLHGIILTNMKTEKINGRTIAYSWATGKDIAKNGLNPSDIRLGITCMQDIKDLDIVLTLIELDGRLKGSFRSKTLDTTIYSVALGGGGHKKASVFFLENISMKEAIDKVLEIIKEKGFVKAE